MKISNFIAVLACAVAVGLAASPASASTYCVPDYSSACPATGINEKQADLNTALSLYGADGNPDKVIIAPGTITSATPFKAAGNDPLEIVGAGRDKTFLTSSASGNGYVLDLTSGSNREVTVRNLAVLVPTSFSTGAAVSETGDHFESVDLITRNDGAAAVFIPTAGSSFKDIEVFGQNGASFGAGFWSYNETGCGTGEISFENLRMTGSQTGISWNCPATTVSVTNSSFAGVNSAIDVTNGATVSVTNALIQNAEGPPIRLFNSANKVTTLNLDHVTVVATGDPNQPAIRGRVDSLASPSKNIEINLSNSILTGFAHSWSLETPASPVQGNILLSASHSLTDADGLLTGEASVSSDSNLTGAPTFAGPLDFHLASGSPGIDSGDPTAPSPTVDLEGNLRPVDGDGDGTAVRDMGAFEYQPPTCATDPSLCPKDVTAPKVSRIKFRFRPGKGGSLRMRVSEAASVRVVFSPLPKGRGRAAVRARGKAAKAGPLTLKLGKKKLKAGRYRMTIRATDKSGNRSKPVVRKVKIKS